MTVEGRVEGFLRTWRPTDHPEMARAMAEQIAELVEAIRADERALVSHEATLIVGVLTSSSSLGTLVGHLVRKMSMREIASKIDQSIADHGLTARMDASEVPEATMQSILSELDQYARQTAEAITRDFRGR